MNKVGRRICIQSVLKDGFMFTMWLSDFYQFPWFEMCVILCVEDLVTDFKILLSLMWLDLDDLAGNGVKKGPQSQFVGSIIRKKQRKTSLGSHSKRKIWKEHELVNFKAKRFCWKRVALSDVGIVPQQNLKKRQKIVSTLDVSYALRHLQASLHHLKRSLHVNQEMTFHFSMIDNQNTWMKHDVTFTCVRLLSSRFFRSNPVAADQHVDPAGRGQSSEIGSLPCSNLHTLNFEAVRTCIHSTWKMGFMGCLLILCQFDCWYGLHATMRQAVMIWHSSKVIGSPTF